MTDDETRADTIPCPPPEDTEELWPMLDWLRQPDSYGGDGGLDDC